MDEHLDARTLTPRQLTQLMLDTSRELNKAQQELRDAGIAVAKAANEYRKAHATAMLSLTGMSGPDGKRAAVAEKEAKAEQAVGELHFLKDLAEYADRTAQEAVRNKRQQLSALQSIANAVKAELELSRTGPEGGY